MSNNGMEVVYGLVSVASAFLCIICIYYIARDRLGGGENKRLKRYMSSVRQLAIVRGDAGINSSLDDGERATSSEAAVRMRSILGAVGRALEIKRLTRGVEMEVLRADLPFRAHEFLGFVTVFMLTGVLLVFAISQNPLVSSIVGILGAIGPMFALRIRKAKRIAHFNRQIADALGIISNSLRVGYSFLQSIDLVAKEMPPPVSVEFSRAKKEISLGAGIEEALGNMITRVPSGDLDLVVTAVLIQRQVGGNLAEISDKIAQTISDRTKIQGDIKTLTSQGRLSGTIITVLPFVIGGFLFMMNRSYMTPLFTHPLGQTMLVIGLVGEVLGALIVMRITKIEV